MRPSRVLPVLLLAAGLGIAGCSTDDGSSTASSNSSSAEVSDSAAASEDPAVCDAADALRESIQGLQSVDVSGGVAGLQDAFESVEGDVQQLADAARDQHADRVDQVESDLDDVRSALDAAIASPANRDPGAVTSAVTTLVDDVDALLEEVGQGC